MAVRDTWQRLEDLDKSYEHALRILKQQDSRIARLEHRIREALRREDAPKAPEPVPMKEPSAEQPQVVFCARMLAPRVKVNNYRHNEIPTLVLGGLEPLPATVIVAVAETTTAPWEDILSHKRTERINVGRMLSAFALRELTSMSWETIAALMDRDHATCIHNCGLVRKRMDREGEFKKTVISLMDKIKGLAQGKYDNGSNTVGGGEGPYTGELPHAGGTGNAGPGAAAA